MSTRFGGDIPSIWIWCRARSVKHEPARWEPDYSRTVDPGCGGMARLYIEGEIEVGEERELPADVGPHGIAAHPGR